MDEGTVATPEQARDFDKRVFDFTSSLEKLGAEAYHDNTMLQVMNRADQVSSVLERFRSFLRTSADDGDPESASGGQAPSKAELIFGSHAGTLDVVEDRLAAARVRLLQIIDQECDIDSARSRLVAAVAVGTTALELTKGFVEARVDGHEVSTFLGVRR